MRQVKSVLVVADLLKQKFPSEREESLILKAITQVNFPKFIQDDIPLFKWICKDLFPGLAITEREREDLEDSIKVNLEGEKLQVVPEHYKKIVQLY